MNAYLCTVSASYEGRIVEGQFHVVAGGSGEALLLAMQNIQREVVDRGWVPLSVVMHNDAPATSLASPESRRAKEVIAIAEGRA